MLNPDVYSALLSQGKRAGADFAMKRPNDLSVAGWRPLFNSCAARAHEVLPGLAEALELPKPDGAEDDALTLIRATRTDIESIPTLRR